MFMINADATVGLRKAVVQKATLMPSLGSGTLPTRGTISMPSDTDKLCVAATVRATF